MARLLSISSALVVGDAQVDLGRFQAWKDRHGIAFASSEDQMRAVIFQQNVEFIDKVNSLNLTYQLAENQFTALAPDEFVAMHTGFKPQENPLSELPLLGVHEASADEIFADRLDWREAGAVTPIKNQGSCGSCWAFSATGALEGAWQLASGTLVSLSEQQLVNCAHGEPTKPCIGCLGGNMDMGLKFALKHDICTEREFPYLGWVGMAEVGSCSKKCTGVPKGGFTGYKEVKANDANALMSAVNLLPVSIGIEADQRAFQSYHSGVLSGKCGSKVDHGVLAIGYGTDPKGGDYWLVKNSWGATWGEKGTVRIKRGVPGPGECGILSQPCYAVAKADALV